MTAEPLPWFRFYTEFATDPTVQILAFEDQRHFAMSLCLKGSGLLDREFPTPEARNRVICQALGLDPMAAAEANRRLREVNLVDENWQPINWDKRQFVSDHSAAERKRRQRQREKEQSAVTVTTTSRDSHALDADADADADSEAEGLYSDVAESLSSSAALTRVDEPVLENPKGGPSPGAALDAAKTAARVGAHQTRGSRIPIPFPVTDSMRGWAKTQAPDVDVEAATAEFVDHWRSVSGKDGVKLDWEATWRNRLRMLAQRAKERRKPFAAAPAPFAAREFPS